MNYILLPQKSILFKLYGHFTHADQSRSHGVCISEGPLYCCVYKPQEMMLHVG